MDKTSEQDWWGIDSETWAELQAMPHPGGWDGSVDSCVIINSSWEYQTPEAQAMRDHLVSRGYYIAGTEADAAWRNVWVRAEADEIVIDLEPGETTITLEFGR